MKKLQNAVLSFTIILVCSQNILQAANGAIFGPTQQLNTQGFPQFIHSVNSQATTTSQDGSSSGGAACPSGQICCDSSSCGNNQTSSSFAIPPFYIQILDKKGNVLNPQQTPTNTQGKVLNPNFSLATALLIVQIFPPSNINFTAGKNTNYIIMYTIKDLSGSSVLVDYDIIAATAGVPTGINIPAITATNTQAGLTAISGSTSAAQIILFNSPSDPKNLQNLNNLSPATQKFLFTANPSSDQTTSTGSFTITPISGIIDSFVSQTYTISKATSLSNLSIYFNQQNPQNNQITISDTPFLNSQGSTVPFDSTDLQKGVILSVNIYPSNGSNYPVIATLATSDGSKYRKLYSLDNSSGTTTTLSYLPSTIYIKVPGRATPLPINFLNSNALNSLSSNNSMIYPINIIAPMNLQFLITQ